MSKFVFMSRKYMITQVAILLTFGGLLHPATANAEEAVIAAQTSPLAAASLSDNVYAEQVSDENSSPDIVPVVFIPIFSIGDNNIVIDIDIEPIVTQIESAGQLASIVRGHLHDEGLDDVEIEKNVSEVLEKYTTVSINSEDTVQAAGQKYRYLGCGLNRSAWALTVVGYGQTYSWFDLDYAPYSKSPGYTFCSSILGCTIYHSAGSPGPNNSILRHWLIYASWGFYQGGACAG